MSTEPNRYEAPEATLAAPDAVTNEELSAFVGSNARLYLARWSRLRAGQSQLAGFNWPAALFTLPWLAYRRLYVYMLPAWLLPIIVTSILQLFPASATVLGLAQVVLGVLLIVLFGLIANPLLYHRALSVISRSGGELAKVRERGGTSVTAAWITVVLLVLIGVATSVVPLLALDPSGF